MTRRAVTVDGLVAAEDLGLTLPHEHLLLDMGCRYSPAADDGSVELPSLEGCWRLRRAPAGYRKNLDGTDVDAAIGEAAHFVAAGGRTIVDVTTVGLRPDLAGLREVARATGLNVIAATGVYVDLALPEWVRQASVEELADLFVDEIETGGPEGIRRGVIGEIGIEGPTDLELKAVAAAARAQGRTGAPCYLHVMSGILPPARPSVFEVVDLYRREGGDLRRLVLCHQDGSGDDPSYQEEMLKQGLWFEYDTFGFESVFAFGDDYIQLPTDSQRIAELAALIEAGFGEQLLISQDICYQMQRRSWGGWGYAHIVDSLGGRFRAAGIDDSTRSRLMVDNPAQLLAFA